MQGPDRVAQLRRGGEVFLPSPNPTFGNPPFDEATARVLIVRLSPLRDVSDSLPHLFLFHEVRRALPQAFIDFAFFPSAKERALLDQLGEPYLLGIQSLRPAGDFDLVLVSNAYTLELINLPYLLLRSGIPLLASQRRAGWPPLILGGSNALAVQALIRPDGDSLVDGIFFGEGEGWVGELARGICLERKGVEELGRHVEGLWAAGAFRPVTKAVLKRPQADLLPLDYPILNVPEAHSASLQITYGCPAFCVFCFEGYDRKPYRELPLSEVLAAARHLKRMQGVEELGLYSFNFNTHSEIFAMILELHKLFDRVTLKSQRLDILHRTPGLLEAEVSADKRDFSLGIEGISTRMRAWLHKSLDTQDIQALLERLFVLRVRRVKLFYLLTGYESAEDLAEFRHFVRWLKGVRYARNRSLRVIFSFGLLVRMPFTPLQYDRLFLDEGEWKYLIGQVKSICETNGFEFRLAFDWPAYCTTQVLALGGYWLAEPIVSLAERGYFFDTTLSPQYWQALKGWMEENGYWNAAFLGEKGMDYPFALEFVASNISPAFLYRQYQEAKRGVDSGYCLGAGGGRCLGCAACVAEEQRKAIVTHAIRFPEEAYAPRLAELMIRKHRLQPRYFLVRVAPSLAGVRPEFLNAFVFRGVLMLFPELVENLLAVRESLFTVGANRGRFPLWSGETVFAFKAWDVAALEERLAGRCTTGEFEVIGPVEGFTPGVFSRLDVELRLCAALFPEPRAHLERYLRSEYLAYSLRREGEGYRFELPARALKKKVLLGGFFELTDEGFYARLEIGPKFDLGAFLRTFDGGAVSPVRVLGVSW
ncbi:MAG: radical SAM protein [Anaerolineae bacterium]|nr:radical SAM protein [Anaerolineae bacterium]